jgi:hypothetical protein
MLGGCARACVRVYVQNNNIKKRRSFRPFCIFFCADQQETSEFQTFFFNLFFFADQQKTSDLFYFFILFFAEQQETSEFQTYGQEYAAQVCRCVFV